MHFPRSVRLLMVTFVLSVFFGASSSPAWEFSMEGEVLWKNRFVGQLGSRGFFGKYDLDNSSTPGNFASVNGWASGKLNDLSSSSGAADQVMETNVLTGTENQSCHETERRISGSEPSATP